jgi:hypothetical protein
MERETRMSLVTEKRQVKGGLTEAGGWECNAGDSRQKGEGREEGGRGESEWSGPLRKSTQECPHKGQIWKRAPRSDGPDLAVGCPRGENGRMPLQVSGDVGSRLKRRSFRGVQEAGGRLGV